MKSKQTISKYVCDRKKNDNIIQFTQVNLRNILERCGQDGILYYSFTILESI